jgi:hypothetical protein
MLLTFGEQFQMDNIRPIRELDHKSDQSQGY